MIQVITNRISAIQRNPFWILPNIVGLAVWGLLIYKVLVDLVIGDIAQNFYLHIAVLSGIAVATVASLATIHHRILFAVFVAGMVVMFWIGYSR
jgi:hypothetical protein